MKNSVIAILIAIGLIIFGAALAGCSLLGMNGISGKTSLITTQETITEDFANIDLNIIEANVTFHISDDGTCYYIAATRDNMFCTAEVENGTLKIGQDDSRNPAQFIGIFWEQSTLDIYLPQNAYEQLTITGRTSDVHISDVFSFTTVSIDNSTGDLDLSCQVKNDFVLHCSTGDILLRNVSPVNITATVSTGDISLQNISCETITASATTGDMRMENISCKTITAKTSTGDHCLRDVHAETELSITVSTGHKELTDVTCGSLFLKATSGSTKLTNVIATGNATLTSNTGDWDLHSFDAANITITTTTGDVDGTLRSDKIFLTNTSTGEIKVPACTTGGTCKITTDTGDIHIEIAP